MESAQGGQSPREWNMHINCLELLVVHLAVKMNVLPRMDSVSALSYMNKLGV